VNQAGLSCGTTRDLARARSGHGAVACAAVAIAPGAPRRT
jgi:hypothetical protein